jgi:hypothetical protein
VKVPQGSTDADALVAAVGQSNLSYAPSGLLCAIDNYPANGVAECNASANGEFFFWSYWDGKAGSWSYASAGPASTLATPGDVEGWRYQDPGPANSSAPQPSPAPDFSSLCPAEYANAPATATTTPTTHTTAPAVHGAQSTPAVAGGGAKGPGGAASAAGPTTTMPGGPASADPTTTTAPASSAGGQPTRPSLRHDAGNAAHALGPLHHTSPSGGNWLVPLLVGLLIVGLGLAAVRRWRRRPADP